MVINRWITISSATGVRSNVVNNGFADLPAILTPEILYKAIQGNYLKFFKMDRLCKWAWVAAECLFPAAESLAGLDKNRIAVVLGTSHGCMDVDKRYLEGIAMASPALFVYTLPNIMLGELCIRHGFKGEQLCTVSEKFDADEMYFNVSGLLSRGMDTCLCGWVDVFDDHYDACLFWVAKGGQGVSFTPGAMRALYEGK